MSARFSDRFAQVCRRLARRLYTKRREQIEDVLQGAEGDDVNARLARLHWRPPQNDEFKMAGMSNDSRGMGIYELRSKKEKEYWADVFGCAPGEGRGGAGDQGIRDWIVIYDLAGQRLIRFGHGATDRIDNGVQKKRRHLQSERDKRILVLRAGLDPWEDEEWVRLGVEMQVLQTQHDVIVDKHHRQIVNFLTGFADSAKTKRLFTVFALPMEFGDKSMLKTASRSVRRRLGYQHLYKLKQRLRARIDLQHRMVTIANGVPPPVFKDRGEKYTTQGCSRCGHLNPLIGASKVHQCHNPDCWGNGTKCDRDGGSAKNICIKTLFVPVERSRVATAGPSAASPPESGTQITTNAESQFQDAVRSES
jgi:hypothetical protein